MRFRPLALLVAIPILAAIVGCSNEGDSQSAAEAAPESMPQDESAEPTPGMSPAAARADEKEPANEVVDSVDSPSQWEGPAALVVDGVEIEQLTPNYECRNGTCAEPMDYWKTQDFVVALGTEVVVRTTADVDLLPNVRRLSPGLSFLVVDRQPVTTRTAAIVMKSPGLYHVDVLAEVKGETAGDLTRIHYYMWVQVVEASADCLGGAKAVPLQVTGVTDEVGCPVESGSLNISSLHPEFHCAPWPAALSLDSRPRATFGQTSFTNPNVDLVASAASDAATAGVYIAAGEVLVAESDPDAIYVQRPSGEVERWGSAREAECA